MKCGAASGCNFSRKDAKFEVVFGWLAHV